MKKYFFTRESLLAIGIFMFSFTHIWAQNGVKDSLYKELPKPVLDEVYQLKFKEVLVPVMGIGTAALFVCDGWFTEQRENVQDLLSAKGRNKIKFILHKLFGNIVYRAEFHAFHGGINFGVVGHNDEGLHLSLLSHLAQKVYATAVRQTQVGNHDIIICCLLQMFLRG